MKKHSRHLVELIRQGLGEGPLVGAEVGVWEGQNSAALLSRFPKLELCLVDRYKWVETCDLRMNNMTQQDFDNARVKAWEQTEFAKDRRYFVPLDSVEAAKQFDNGRFDFVFLDASHDYESMQNNLPAWYLKIRTGGLFCGHDYGGQHYGVKQAVDEFCQNMAYDKQLQFRSYTRIWWFFK